MPSLLTFRRLVVFAIVACPFVPSGCADVAEPRRFGESAASPPESGSIADAPPLYGSPSDASTSEKVTGSLLCPVERHCLPDNGGVSGAAEERCASLPDGGPRTCRIAPPEDGGVATIACLPSTRNGTDGAACEDGAECAPGHECVASATGAGGVCRRYCCSTDCAPSQSGGATFCDVQLQLQAARKTQAKLPVPVCVPLKPCTLLGDQECAGETCAIVNESGDSGCVEVGSAPVGASCDATHCARHLTCLGLPGNRRCYQLCEVGSAVGSATCGPSLVCKTSSAFKNTKFGVCQAE